MNDAKPLTERNRPMQTPKQILEQALTMADPDHPDFADSPADVVQFLCENAQAIGQPGPAVVLGIEGGTLQRAWAGDPETTVELFDFDDADELPEHKKDMADALAKRTAGLTEVEVASWDGYQWKDHEPDSGPDRWQAARTLTCDGCGKTIDHGEQFLTDPLGELDGVYCSTACFEDAVELYNETP